MAHQNQETNPVDPASFQLKRKRGRPRKYDGPDYEPRRRIAQPHVISSRSYPSPGLSQGPMVNPPQANLSAVLSLGSQVGSSKPNAAVGSAHGFQDIPSQSNLAPISGFRPHYNAILAVPPHLRDSGPQKVQAHTVPTESNLGMEGQANPSQPSLVSNSRNQPSANLPANSSNGPHTLLGQKVSGILDGTFETGYLLTVRLDSTGEILKGLVFDQRLCVPISVENDVAPDIPMIMKGNLGSVDEAINCQPVSSSAQSVPKSVSVDPPQRDEPVAPLDPINYAPKSSRPIGTTSELIRNAIKIDGNPAPDDARHAVQAEVQIKQLQPMLATKDTDENEKSLQDTLQQHNLGNAGQEIIEDSSSLILEALARDLHQAVESSAVKELAIGNEIQNSQQNKPQQPAVGNAVCETLLGLAINNEAIQINSDQTGNMTGTPGLDERKRFTEESFKVLLDATEKGHELNQAVEFLPIKEQGDQVESALLDQHGGDQDHKLDQVPSPGQTPAFLHQIPDEQLKLPEDHKRLTSDHDAKELNSNNVPGEPSGITCIIGVALDQRVENES